MIKEIYFRDLTDPKYRNDKLEINDELESVLNKVRMILFTNKGDVLGYPDLGMNLDDYIFDFNFNENQIRSRFYSQIYKYIPDRSYLIELDTNVTTDGVKNYVNLYIKINNQPVLGLILK